jgi:hypothetical protein
MYRCLFVVIVVAVAVAVCLKLLLFSTMYRVPYGGLVVSSGAFFVIGVLG